MNTKLMLLGWLTDEARPDYGRDEVWPVSPAGAILLGVALVIMIVVGVKAARESSAAERRRRAAVRR